jgi:hypothetical protein
MKAKTFIQHVAGLTLTLILLTACGGGTETNFSVNNDGFDFQFSEPKFFAEETFTSELLVANHIRIRLEVACGDIVIEGQSDNKLVTVIAKKMVGSDSLEDAEMHLNELEILVTDEADEILVQTLQPENTQGRKYIVDYHIIIPNDLETEVNLNNGDVDVIDVQNSVMVDGVNGDVFLSNIFGNAIVDLTNGSINSAMDLPLNGEIIMSTDNGSIDLNIPTSTSAIFAASVDNGLISTSNLEFDAAVQTPKSLTGTLGNGEGIIELSSINGNIDVVGIN